MSYKPEYKTGDRVVIKPWKLMEEQYGLHGDGDINTPGAWFAKDMEDVLRGTDRVVVLRENDSKGNFLCDRHPRNRYISPDMILGYAFEYGDEIEVSDDGKNWRVIRFCAYVPGQSYEVRSCYGNPYRYARPIQKEPEVEINISATCNGKPFDLSKISEESVIAAWKASVND